MAETNAAINSEGGSASCDSCDWTMQSKDLGALRAATEAHMKSHADEADVGLSAALDDLFK